MENLTKDSGLLIWIAIGLIVTAIAAAVCWKKSARKAFVVTLMVVWLGGALVYFLIGMAGEYRREQLVAELRLELLSLCAALNRSVIVREARDVEEVAIWPPQGPRDSSGNDLFFHSEKSAQDWLRGREAGRYGGFRNVVLLSPDESKERTAPRYFVTIEELNTRIPEGENFIVGARTRVIDRNTHEVIADRSDYAGKGEVGFTGGCDAMQSTEPGMWSHRNLEFIYKVLKPLPGVQVIRKTLPMLGDSRIEKLAPRSIAAKLLDERAPTPIAQFVREKLPPEVRYKAEYKSTPGGAVLHDYALGFLFKDRDLWISQGLGTSGSLLAFAKDAREYAALFWIDSRDVLLLRRFNMKGDLTGQERVQLPKSIRPVQFAGSPDKQLLLEPSRYRVVLSINLVNGEYEKDIELAIPRTRRGSKNAGDE